MSLKCSQIENNKMTYTRNAIRAKLPVERCRERIMVYYSDYKHEALLVDYQGIICFISAYLLCKLVARMLNWPR